MDYIFYNLNCVANYMWYYNDESESVRLQIPKNIWIRMAYAIKPNKYSRDACSDKKWKIK